MQALPEQIPALKSAWLNTGDTDAFLMGLRSIAVRAWTLSVTKFQPVTLTPLWGDQALAATE